MVIVILYILIIISFTFRIFELMKKVRENGFKKQEVFKLLFNFLIFMMLIILLAGRVKEL